MAVFFVTRFQEGETLIQGSNAKKIHSSKGIEIWKGGEDDFVFTGLGRDRMSVGVALFFSQYFWETREPKNRIIINYGSCGSSNPDLDLGSVYSIHKIHDLTTDRDIYPDQIFASPFPTMPLITSPKPVVLDGKPIWKNYTKLKKPSEDSLYDMEGISFFQSANQCLGSENLVILKYISDYCDGNSCEPSLYSKINPKPVLEWAKTIESSETFLTSLSKDLEILRIIEEKWQLSDSSFIKLKNLIHYFQKQKLQSALDELISYNPEKWIKKDTLQFIDSIYAKYLYR
jgi:hypothetical protein